MSLSHKGLKIKVKQMWLPILEKYIFLNTWFLKHHIIPSCILGRLGLDVKGAFKCGVYKGIDIRMFIPVICSLI